MSDTYKCAACGGVFEKGWTDEEAQEEYEKMFGGNAPECKATVCDDCYKEMTE